MMSGKRAIFWPMCRGLAGSLHNEKIHSGIAEKRIAMRNARMNTCRAERSAHEPPQCVSPALICMLQCS